MLAAAGALVLLGLGALWMQWLISEVSSAPAPQGHHDFFAFYAAGTLLREHHPQWLYSAPALTGIERHILDAPVGAAGYMPFLNPPVAAALLSPLAGMSEPAARIVWLVVSISLAVACVLVATAGLRRELRALALALLLTTYPAYQAFVEGQWSFLLLLGCLAALAAARRGHPLLAGAALAVLWLKPPLLLLALVWLVLTGRWRTAGGALVAVVLVTAAALPWTGVQSNADYLAYLGGVGVSHAVGAGALGATAWEGGLVQMEGLIGLAATIAGQQHAVAVDALTLASSLALLAFFLLAGRARWIAGSTTVREGMAAVCVALLLDPHLYAQDCVLIIVLMAMALRRVRTPSARVAVILACCAAMDLAALDTLWTPGMPLWPPHLLTLTLLAAAVVLVWPKRFSLHRRAVDARLLSNATS
jgi:Glycosyltransferase family 87